MLSETEIPKTLTAVQDKIQKTQVSLLELLAIVGNKRDELAETYRIVLAAHITLNNHEKELKRKVNSVFKPLDSTGKVIHTKDKVKLADDSQAVVVAIISIDNVHIEPEKGTVISVDPASLTVIDSFIGKLIDCSTDQELLAIIEAAKLNVKVEPSAKKERKTAPKVTLEASDI